MIKHIVMWNFADDNQAANLARAKELLDSLVGLVPGMGTFETAIGADGLEHSFDLVLYSEFDDAAALTAYANHPDHVAVAEFIASVRTERVAFDYEV